MATVGELIEFLSCFEASMSLQILVAGGGSASEMVDVAASVKLSGSWI